MKSDDEIVLKSCRRCQQTKNVSQFLGYVSKRNGRFYYRSYCKKCLVKFNNERRMSNPRLHEKVKARHRAYYHRTKNV